MKAKKKRRYKGELAKPIHVGSIPIETTSEEQSDWIKQQFVEQELIEKLPLLMEYYKIADNDDYFSLALALARHHVPGFRVVQAKLKLKHGDWGAVIKDRCAEWPRERLLSLLGAVEEAKQKHGFSTDREAIEFLMQKRKWQPRASYRGESKQRLETLESRLQDAKRISREERDGPALNPASAAVLCELEEAARLATATLSAAAAFTTLPLELRFTALCLPFSIEQNSGIFRN
jgi:hypothetical protein